MTDARLGYRSCRKHGRHPGFGDRIDINCSDCIRWPKRKMDSEYVGDLRVFYGLLRFPEQVSIGEQLAMEGVSSPTQEPPLR